MARRQQLTEHLLRRAGFGAAPDQVEQYAGLSYTAAVDSLVNFAEVADDVDSHAGQAGYVGITARGTFAPTSNVTDARQRWLFRMVHTERPLQEKMALFWHNHFATAYTKIAGALGADVATRLLMAKPSEDAAAVTGQIELFRKFALGNFRDLLIAVAQDPAMLVWLDGRTNVKAKPQENFARELMELFTMGVGNYQETDVYAGARVFTGWNLAFVGDRTSPSGHYAFSYVSGQHETSDKTFSFPIYTNGGSTIPARAAANGMQDGLDMINAVARHPATGPRLARKLYAYFINEVDPPDEDLIADLARTYYASNFEMKPVVRTLLLSPQFTRQDNFYKRYAWPAEFVIRSIIEVGWRGFSVNDALTPMSNMGQQLLEPPDVAGWDLGTSWFSSGAMLARMNFAAQLATNQKFELRNAARGLVRSPENLVAWALDRMTTPSFDTGSYNALLDYARAGGGWTGSEAQLATKTSGVAHLIVGSGEYQLV